MEQPQTATDQSNYPNEEVDDSSIVQTNANINGNITGSDTNMHEEEIICAICGSMPCEWIEFGTSMLQNVNMTYPTNGDRERIDDSNVVVDNERMRKTLYKMFTREKYGHLGKGNRIPLPNCVVVKIREAFPDPENKYMGFHEE